jgi:polyisoprenoid-binding protein YceI
MFRTLLTVLAVAAPAVHAADVTGLLSGRYLSDPSHTVVVFRIDHLGLQKFTATFDSVSATLDIDPADPASARLTATIPVRSLDLPAPPAGFYDTLMVPPWFDAEAHPEMRFASTAVTPTGEATADVAGTLSINGNEAPVTLQVTFNGGYPPGQIEPTPRLGFSATGSLRRSEFGMADFIPAPGTTLGIGDEITFEIEAEFSGPAPG